MPNIITTARGEQVDLDVIKIKGQLAQAPMAIEVERRKRLIETKDEKPKRTIDVTVSTDSIKALEELKQASGAPVGPAPESFDAIEEPVKGKKKS